MMASAGDIDMKLVHLCLVDAMVKLYKAFGKQCNSTHPLHTMFLSFHLVGNIEEGNRGLNERKKNTNKILNI